MQTQSAAAVAVPAAELAEIVRNRLSGRVRAFELIMESAGLVLRGRTRTYYGKQLAQQAVMEVTSLPILANCIEVVSASGEPTA